MVTIVTISELCQMLIYGAFNRVLHWIEETQEGIFLVQIDLENMIPVVLCDNLGFPTLAENIEQRCIYTVTIDVIQNISISSVPTQVDNDNLCVLGLSLNPQSQFISIFLI